MDGYNEYSQQIFRTVHVKCSTIYESTLLNVNNLTTITYISYAALLLVACCIAALASINLSLPGAPPASCCLICRFPKEAKRRGNSTIRTLKCMQNFEMHAVVLASCILHGGTGADALATGGGRADDS